MSFLNSMQALKVFCTTDAELEFVHSQEDVPGFDFLRLSRDKSIPVELLVDADRLEQFKQDLDDQNIKYDVFVNDVSVVIEEELEKQKQFRKLRAGTGISFDSFPSYAEVILSFLTRQIDFLVTIVVYSFEIT